MNNFKHKLRLLSRAEAMVPPAMLRVIGGMHSGEVVIQSFNATPPLLVPFPLFSRMADANTVFEIAYTIRNAQPIQHFFDTLSAEEKFQFLRTSFVNPVPSPRVDEAVPLHLAILLASLWQGIADENMEDSEEELEEETREEMEDDIEEMGEIEGDKSFEDLIQLFIISNADLYVENSEGESPLHSAVFCSNLKIVRVLLDAGADPNWQSTQTGEFPLHRLFDMGTHEVEVDERIAILNLLKEKGADVNCHEQGHQSLGFTPLQSLCLEGTASALQLIPHLLEAGANINEKDFKGMTPLFRTVNYSKELIIDEYDLETSYPAFKDIILLLIQKSTLSVDDCDKIQEELRAFPQSFTDVFTPAIKEKRAPFPKLGKRNNSKFFQDSHGKDSNAKKIKLN